MKTVAVTGSLGSGKSTVLKFVSKNSVPVIDCDAVVSKLYRNKAVQRKLRRLFGSAKRKEIRDIALSSRAKRKKLEKLLRPLVWREVKARLSSLRKQGRQLAFVEVPLLFEANWQKRFNAIVFVRASKKRCIQRLLKKGFSRKAALGWWDLQLSPKKKVKRAHYLIDNSGSLANTKKQVGLLIAKMR